MSDDYSLIKYGKLINKDLAYGIRVSVDTDDIRVLNLVNADLEKLFHKYANGVEL